MQKAYKIVANRFFIKIYNNNNIIIVNNNLIVAKSRQLKTKNIENCFYFVYINIKSFVLNVNKTLLTKDVNRLAYLVKYLVIVYLLETRRIRLYIKD